MSRTSDAGSPPRSEGAAGARAERWGCTRRGVLIGAGAAAATPALGLLAACAPPVPEPWSDGTFWADGTGWVD